MIGYMKYIAMALLASLVVACHHDGDVEELQGGVREAAIVLNVEGGSLGVETRASDIEDNEVESAIRHLDIMIFEDAEDDADKHLFYHQRATTASASGAVRLGVNIDDIVLGAKYWVYVVANSTLDVSTYANVGSVESLFDLEEELHNSHLTGLGLQNTPSHFLMDGCAYMGASEPTQAAAIVIAEEKITDTVELNVRLRRAAAKVVVKLIAGEAIEFTNDIEDATPGYYVRNAPYVTRVMNDGVVRQSEHLETTHESMTSYYKWIADEHGKVTAVEITLYLLSHTWQTNDSFSYATNLLVDIPALYSTEIDGAIVVKPHPNNYYQVPMSRDFRFQRNHYYEVTANVHAPGAEDFSEPVIIGDLKYSVHPWAEHRVDIGGEDGPEYLKVNLDELKMYNTDVDSTSLLFSSSSPVTITVTDSYYIDKFGIRQDISASTYRISGTTDDGAISGNITVHSTLPTNNTIRYFTLIVTNETGQQEMVLVEQFPLVYVVNVLGHYSYRDDFKSGNNAPTTIYNQGSSIGSVSLGRWSAATGCWSYTYSASPGGFWTSKVVRETYPSTHYNASYRGRSDIDYYGYYSSGWGDSNVQLRYSGAQDPGNARMYHVRITATSEDYNLGVPRLTSDPNVDFEFTDSGDDNANLVSPSFMIASRLGFVNSNNFGAADTQTKRLSLSRDHCAYYVEVADDGTVYDDWRLPTASELRIIMQLQGTSSQSADAIDYLLNADYYYSASGPVFNPKNDGNVSESRADEDSWAIRCIRDAY